MKHLILPVVLTLFSTGASAAITRSAADVHGVTVFVTKDEHSEGRKCELKSIAMNTKANAHVNQPGHRLTLELRKPRSSYYDCPATVTMNLDTRSEALKLYELVRSAHKIICQSSSVVSGAHVNLTCDGSFELREVQSP